MQWKFETRKLSDIKPWGKNPRKLNKRGMEDLNKSISKFGLPEPIVINTDGTIIGGHGRFFTLKKQKAETVFCAVPETALTEKEFEELNIRLNKNVAGEFDFDILANEFELSDLVDWGFDEKDLQIDLGDEPEQEETDTTRLPFGDERDKMELKDLLNTFNKIYVQFSGGKDSIAQLLLLFDIGIEKEKIIITCCMTTMDPPDFENYLDYLERVLKIKILRLFPEGSKEKMFRKYEDLLVRYGFPGRMNNWCNTMFKIKPFKPFEKEMKVNNGVVCMGTRSDESAKRAKMNSRGLWGKQKMAFVYPIFDFSDQDVKDIINKHKIKLHFLYKTDNRLSCMQCYQQGKYGWAKLRINYPEEWQKALHFFSLAMKNEKFITGPAGYQHDLFSQIIADPAKYGNEPAGFEDCEYWGPNET
jgi:3'-phosphoadenosine 5'-phosphosulfate sulfotransferase (PAPS reductase)/FAD synthetase